jgi:hypothetical protein
MSSPLSPELLNAIEAGCDGVSPGPWETDTTRSDGSYGFGEDTYEGFDAYQLIGPPLYPGGRDVVICDTLNSDASLINEEFGEESHNAWDEQGRKNMAHIARLDPATVRELVAGYRRGLAPVKIKPLEWRWIEYGFPPLWRAVTRIAVYDVEEVSGSDGPSYDALRGVVNIGNYEDPDLAKAACQRDYEANIRSALEVPHV